MIATHSAQPENVARELEPRLPAVPHNVSENRVIAALLTEISALLADQGASEYRVHAYQNASRMLGQLETPVQYILEEEGLAGLVALPTIGRSIANLIEQYVQTGRVPLLHHLRGDDTAERVFASLPTLGPELSRRIHEHLEIETLPELMRAVQDGRLEQVPGIGRKRSAVIGQCLTEWLRQSPLGTAVEKADPGPDQSVPLSELLDIDAEYRRLAAEGKLPKITPRKFNPGSVAWLPILHTHRGPRHYTALYSNTARAHQLNTTKDWVVIYRDDPESHGRWTVITSRFGKLQGWRIIRGREDECAQYYIHTNTT